MVLKESNVLSLVDELDNITYWCKNIVQLYTNDSSFKKDISSFYNSLSGEDQKKLFEELLETDLNDSEISSFERFVTRG